MKRTCFIQSTDIQADKQNNWVLIELHGDLESATGSLEDSMCIGGIKEKTKV